LPAKEITPPLSRDIGTLLEVERKSYTDSHWKALELLGQVDRPRAAEIVLIKNRTSSPGNARGNLDELLATIRGVPGMSAEEVFAKSLHYCREGLESPLPIQRALVLQTRNPHGHYDRILQTEALKASVQDLDLLVSWDPWIGGPILDYALSQLRPDDLGVRTLVGKILAFKGNQQNFLSRMLVTPRWGDNEWVLRTAQSLLTLDEVGDLRVEGPEGMAALLSPSRREGFLRAYLTPERARYAGTRLENGLDPRFESITGLQASIEEIYGLEDLYKNPETEKLLWTFAAEAARDYGRPAELIFKKYAGQKESLSKLMPLLEASAKSDMTKPRWWKTGWQALMEGVLNDPGWKSSPEYPQVLQSVLNAASADPAKVAELEALHAGLAPKPCLGEALKSAL
jgi:hypothetical protein